MYIFNKNVCAYNYKKILKEYDMKDIIKEIAKVSNQELLYCKQCNEVIIPKIKKNMKFEYQTLYNKFKILHCKNCIKEYKEKNTIVDKSSLIIKFKFGEECYKFKYDNHDTSSKDFFINKYGEEEGLKRFKQKNKKTRGDKLMFINKYGEEEGLKRFKQKQYKSKHTKNKYIKEYGKEEGERLWNEYIIKKKKTSIRSIDYWLNKTDGDYKEAKLLLKNYQTNDKNYYINKYGKEKGEEIYAKVLIKKLFTNTRYSKISQELFWEIYKEIKNDFKKIYFATLNNEYFINIKNEKIIFLDFFIKDINFYIEFFGDFWHGNPLFYNENDYHNVLKKSVKEIWYYDNKKIQILKNNNINGIIIWENDYYKNKKNIIDYCIHKIKENVHGNNKY